MDEDKEFVVKELEQCLTDLALLDGSVGRTLGVWNDKWDSSFDRADTLLPNNSKRMIGVWSILNGFQNISDEAVVNSKKAKIYSFISQKIEEISGINRTKDLLAENISKIKNNKLQILLTQFNQTKDVAVELAAIASRTIIAMICIEAAKAKKPDSKLANTDDMNPDPIIEEAIKLQVFNSGQIKLLKSFKDGPKKSFDNVVHKFGSDFLADKRDIENFVSLLNALLPSIYTLNTEDNTND